MSLVVTPRYHMVILSRTRSQEVHISVSVICIGDCFKGELSRFEVKFVKIHAYLPTVGGFF